MKFILFFICLTLIVGCTTTQPIKDSPIRDCSRACDAGKMLGYDDENAHCKCQLFRGGK